MNGPCHCVCPCVHDGYPVTCSGDHFHRLMKIAAEFTIEASQAWTAEMATKRTTYIHCVAQQLCQVTYLADTDIEALQTVMVNLLSEIESVESAGAQLETFD